MHGEILYIAAMKVAHDGSCARSAGSGNVFGHGCYRRWLLETFSSRVEKRICEFFSSWKALARLGPSFEYEADQFKTWHWKNSFSYSMLGASVVGYFTRGAICLGKVPLVR